MNAVKVNQITHIHIYRVIELYNMEMDSTVQLVLAKMSTYVVFIYAKVRLSKTCWNSSQKDIMNQIIFTTISCPVSQSRS